MQYTLLKASLKEVTTLLVNPILFFLNLRCFYVCVRTRVCIFKIYFVYITFISTEVIYPKWSVSIFSFSSARTNAKLPEEL